MTHPIRYMTESETMNYLISMQKESINDLAREAYYNARRRGKIKDEDCHEIIYIGINEELNEFCDATDNPSEHLPQYTERQEELADVLICCLTELHREGVNVETIIKEKIEYNKTRV